MILRDYQADLAEGGYRAWASGAKVILIVLPTGGGKTPIESHFLKSHKGYSCIIAHRHELVSQISLNLARSGVMHTLCAPNAIVRAINRQHVVEFGQSFYSPNSKIVVASVGTLAVRNEPWIGQVTLWLVDEGHHLLRDNIWGRVVSRFHPKAKGGLFTAHPERSDGRGLSRDACGLVDEMLVGPSGRDLIDAGYLSDYIIRTPPLSYSTEGVEVSSATGDFKQRQLDKVVKEHVSRVVGSVVECYKKFADGLLGVTFATNITEAENFTQGYKDAGIPAALITAKTPLSERMEVRHKFEARKILQLVNVDIFGEGFDLPALSVVSFARSTASRNLYSQQFGRSLRIFEGKRNAIIIDHVGNFERHGFPDVARSWELGDREKRSVSAQSEPIKRCLNPDCFRPYSRYLSKCPYCGDRPVPVSRSNVEHVEGDLLELDLKTLAAMRAQVDQPFDAGRYFKTVAQRTALKRHKAKAEMQENLRRAIGVWAARKRLCGADDSQSYREFYHKFGVDVLSAQALGEKDAAGLMGRINEQPGT